MDDKMQFVEQNESAQVHKSSSSWQRALNIDQRRIFCLEQLNSSKPHSTELSISKGNFNYTFKEFALKSFRAGESPK